MTGCKQQLHVDYIPTDSDASDVTNTIILTTALGREARFFKLSELCSTVCLVAFAMYLALIAGLAVLLIAACASSKLS